MHGVEGENQQGNAYDEVEDAVRAVRDDPEPGNGTRNGGEKERNEGLPAAEMQMEERHGHVHEGQRHAADENGVLHGQEERRNGHGEERGAHGAHAGQKSAQAPGHGRSDLHPVG